MPCGSVSAAPLRTVRMSFQVHGSPVVTQGYFQTCASSGQELSHFRGQGGPPLGRGCALVPRSKCPQLQMKGTWGEAQVESQGGSTLAAILAQFLTAVDKQSNGNTYYTIIYTIFQIIYNACFGPSLGETRPVSTLAASSPSYLARCCQSSYVRNGPHGNASMTQLPCLFFAAGYSSDKAGYPNWSKHPHGFLLMPPNIKPSPTANSLFPFGASRTEASAGSGVNSSEFLRRQASVQPRTTHRHRLEGAISALSETKGARGAQHSLEQAITNDRWFLSGCYRKAN